MAGVGRAVREGKRASKQKAEPQRGEIKHAPGTGWQYGKVPTPPPGLLPATRKAYATWMGSWFAAFWTPADLPAIEAMTILYDLFRRGDHPRHGELRLMMDTMGVTPKGQQDRRWRPPETNEGTAATKPKDAGTYGKLKAVE